MFADNSLLLFSFFRSLVQNAALLAVRMLSIGDPSLLLAMDVYMKNAEKTVAAKAEKMTAEGLLYEVP